MDLHSLAVVLSLTCVVGCGGAPPAETSTATTTPPVAAQGLSLFPERPAFDAIAPTRPNLFKQETWTELTSGGAQHCHEWAFDAAEETSLRDEANEVLASLGVVARFGGTVREDGLALSLGEVGSDVLVGAERPLVKLVACTEDSATLERHRAFVAPIETRALALLGDTRELPALRADVGWERRYADGRRQIGVRWRGPDNDVIRAWMLRRGYREAPTPSGAIDLVRGPERVRFLGEVWWQSEVPAD